MPRTGGVGQLKPACVCGEGGGRGRWWKGLALGSGKRDETERGPLKETKRSVLTAVWTAHGKGQARALYAT